MFRQRQKLMFMPSSSCCLPSASYDEDGNCSHGFSSGHEVLPDANNFRLKNLLKAGVPLEKVNTVVVDSGRIDLSAIPVSQSDDKSSVKSVETNVSQPDVKSSDQIEASTVSPSSTN